MEKPDYILNFKKPKNTEIKYINGYWYLYERINVYDPIIRRSRKKSGSILGKITERGFVPSRKIQAVEKSLQNDVVEIGACNYFLQMSADIKASLEKYFPEMWQEIYVISILRAIYDGRFKRLPIHYEDSILSYVFPDLLLDKKSISQFLRTLGRKRNSIRAFMEDNIRDNDRFILFDGHRLLSSAKHMDNAELGYDSKHRYKPQINLIYLFSMGSNTGTPLYYKQFIGSTPDVTAFEDILNESHCYGRDCTVIADKGFASDADFGLLEDSSLNYIIPLKRGNKFVKGKVPPRPTDYDEAFSYNKRAVQAKTFAHEGHNIHLFLDADLLAKELSDLTGRTEKKNRSTEMRKAAGKKKISKGKGRLTQEELDQMVPLKIDDMFENKEEIGTITIKTNNKSLNAFQVYSIYKQRQAIEQFFKTYADTMEFEASYMKDNYCEEAWLFLNHLSSIFSIRILEEISSIGEEKNISYKDFVQTLVKIKSNIISETEWRIVPIKRSVQKLCDKLEYDPSDFQNIMPQEN